MRAKTFIPTQRMTEVNRLIDGLLAEDFAISQKIEDATLDSIQALFEEIEESSAENGPPPELAEMRESYQASKELFCLILMELEAMNASGNETLHELRNRDAGTQLLNVRIQSSRTSSPTPSLTLVSSPDIELPTTNSQEAVPPPTDYFAAQEPDPSEPPHQENNGQEAENLWNTHLEADSRLNPTKKSRGSSSALLATPALRRPAVEPPAQAQEDMVTPEAHENEVEEVTIFRFPEVEKIVAPTAVGAPLAPVATKPTFDCKTEDYLNLAKQFQDTIPSLNSHRFEAQCLIFSVECELWARLNPTIHLFWPKKESAIREILDSGNKRFDFHPVLKKGLESLAKEGHIFLPSSGLPYSAILNSVRFLLSSPLWNSFWPLPIELGMLILLFGGERTMRGLILGNSLHLDGLTAEEGTEIAFRLFRCQIARNRVLTPLGEAPEMDIIREDTARILELATQLASGQKPSGEKE